MFFIARIWAAEYNKGNSWVHPTAQKYVNTGFVNAPSGMWMVNGSIWYLQDFENDGAVNYDASLPVSPALSQFTGSSKQQIFGTGTTRFYNVLFNSSLIATAFSLQQNISIAHQANFTQGIITAKQTLISTMENMVVFEAGASCTNASNNSYVDGFVRKIGNTAFQFPVGNKGYLRPASISSPSYTTDHFTARYVYLNPDSSGYTRTSRESDVKSISNKEYWIINRTNGISNVQITLGWDVNTTSAIVPSNLKNIVIARWNGTKWVNEGNITTTGNATSGTITAKASTYGVFTIATLNDLPVAVTDTVTLTENTKTEGSVATNDTTSADGGNVWKLLTNPLHGTVTMDTQGNYTYTPENDYSGTDSFTYTLTDADGDSSTATVELTITGNNEEATVTIPDGFSPNGDGYNDVFIIPHSSEMIIKLEVFNRWGELVYKSSDYQNDWDGKGSSKFMGRDLLNGTYYYVVQAKNTNTGRTKKYVGYLTLRR
ncbi:MAG: gliding motility-associated C-terminal domain-containing protein [Paludibacteraceae bacterium]|nr:gliding motility-associated C-terminal domain-containing protein [Paludibacteraceae bacterium]